MIYNSYSELTNYHKIDEDFRIDRKWRRSPIVVCAIHGGLIEEGTTELAEALSSELDASYYSFIGTMSKNNYQLHIDSTRYDEQSCISLVRESIITISIHGCDGTDRFTYVGGRDIATKHNIIDSIVKNGFESRTPMTGLAALSSDNICNRNRRGKGVQLELSLALRRDFKKNEKVMYKYIKAIQDVVNTMR
jgi:phage replication-related protein YjqB (UPF0714/DUF867 family)